ncbi:sterile alpha motif domain-containing protein 9-like [Saccostrea echinata]|uniref:sterile alpha motif domain-containing protein 9-like n=1 Tax=Saccostrea echinata TaxID=191078 RepID=UPI002A7F9CC8|nr:sterile alpha motif domain-containing protein 9-like [Saccostrea echinata]
MDTKHRLKIQKNYTYLLEELRAQDIVDNLYTDCVIEHDDLQRISSEVTDKDKAKCLINILYTKERAFVAFLEEVGKDRPDIKEKIQQTDVGEELGKEKERRIEFLKKVLQKRYRLTEGKTIAEPDLLKDISFEYWWEGKGDVTQSTKTDLAECIQTLYPTSIRKRVTKKNKKIWRYTNIERRESEISEDEESVTDPELVSNSDGADSFHDALHPTILFKDIKPSDLKSVLAPFCEKEGIEAIHLEVFVREKIDGKVFEECDITDLGHLFRDMPFGDRKRLLRIRNAILEEESKKGPYLVIPSSGSEAMEGTDTSLICQNRVLSESEENDPETKFKEIFRTFDTLAKPTDAYRRHAVLTTSNFYISDLIEPLHSFRHRDDQDQSSLMNWIAEETIKFACACFSGRTNGTIHFGIVENTDKDGLLEGKVAGLYINQSRFMEVFYDQIKQAFYKDQLGIVLQCLRPPQFVSVRHKVLSNEEAEPLFVVEIDVVPNYSLTNHDTFYIREKNVPRIYNFDRNVPKVLLDEDLKNYMESKPKLAEHRKRKEEESLPSETNVNLREQFLNFYTAGSEKLTNDIYPILFLSPLDSAMNEDFVSENFEFLLNMEPTAIFDFHSSLDGKCLYNFVEADLQRVVKVYTTDNFDRNSEENASNPDNLNNVLEELSTSQLKPWIFCNGYEPLRKIPLNRLEWKKRRSEGFKEVTRFLQQEIPNERALVVFLILSKNYDIMLEIAEEVILKFQNQWIAMSENEKLMENWRDELLRRDSVDKKTLKERCIIGLPWKHVNNIVKEVSNFLPKVSKCQLPTSAGAFCYLKEKIRNELCDLEILSSNECEIDDICHDTHKLENHRRFMEEKFYQGGQVTWWNLYFEDNHVLRRSQQEKIQQGVEKLLQPNQRFEDTRVPCFYLFHQPGAGGTTTAHQILWQFRKSYRCSLIRKITDQTCSQIERLKYFEDPNNPMPPILLIDNGDEEKVQDLHARLEYKARISCKNDTRAIYCLLFLCIRRANLPTFTDSHTVQLKHELSTKELEWLRRKYQSLDEMFRNNNGVDPKLLISFNILKENFDRNYIQRTVKEFVDSIDIQKEMYLIKYLSLINSYDIDFQSVPLSAFDTLMEERKKGSGSVLYSMGSVSAFCGRRRHPSNLYRNWESTLSQSTEVLLNRNARVSTGGQALSIISKLFAKAILDYIVMKDSLSIGDIMIEFLRHPLFIAENASVRQLKKIVQDVLKKREFTEDQKKEKFSPIILEINEKEGKDKVAEVLETGYEKTKDPMLAQQIARFYIHSANWGKAEEFAKTAVQSKPDNSYLWDTYGQIYKTQLTLKYKAYLADCEAPNNSEIQEIVKLAMKGIEKFSKEQIVSEESRFSRENDAGYFGEVRLIVQLLDLIFLWFPGKDEKMDLHKYLVNMNNSKEFEIFSGEALEFLKDLQERSEKTMQVIEDKLAQLKNEKDGEILKLNVSYNPRYELVQLRENLDNYFGEQTGEIPDHLSPEAKASYIRRRVKRLGGRSSSSILDLRNTPDGETRLNEMALKLSYNIMSQYAKAYDFVTLITVTLVQNMTRKTFREEDFKNLVEWSRRAYDLTLRLGDDERPQLEAFMYFVMIHWPTEHKMKSKLYKINPVETVEEAIRRWKNAFNRLYPKQKEEAFRRRETTYYFLGKGRGSSGIVYYKDIRCKQTYIDGEALWRSKPVKEMLQQLKGTLLMDGWEILYTVTSPNGNKSFIKVKNSYPSPRSMWQKSVVFYLGFSWSGPKAYIQKDPNTQDDMTLKDIQKGEDVTAAKQSNQTKANNAVLNWQDVATHEAYLNAVRKINQQLQEIESLKKRKDKDLNSKQREMLKKEARLKEEKNDLYERRCKYVDRS